MKLYGVLTPQEAHEVVEKLQGLEWKQGKASNHFATGTVKQNSEILPTDGDRQKELLNGLYEKLSGVMPDNFGKVMVVPKFNRYQVGDAYHAHADAGWMGNRIRTDLACTLFLNDDYEGGELNANGVVIKGMPGQCVVYECWRPHWVNPVTKGERIAAITWIQSGIRSAEHREIIDMFLSVMSDLDRTSNEERLYARLSALYGKLIRMWLD